MYSQIRSVPLLLVIAGLVFAQAPTPAKVAIINAQKAVADTEEIKKAQAALEAKYRPRQQAIEALQRNPFSNKPLLPIWRRLVRRSYKPHSLKNKSNCSALGKIYRLTSMPSGRTFLEKPGGR
jgi:hypothetical protein